MAEIVDIDRAREHRELCRLVLEILRDWEVSEPDQARLLGLEDMTARRWRRIRAGQETLPEDEAVLMRIHLILSIYRRLQLHYPRSAAAADAYVTASLRRLGGRTPLEVMLEGGERGMRVVLEHLQGSGPWG